MKAMKYTIKDLQADFPDEAACLNWLKDYLYPEGIYCKIDKKVTPHHLMKTRKSFSCETCGHHVHPTAGTIFEKSSTPLTLWFYAIYLMASTRAGISAKQLERELGVTYKTAWRMFHQIRKMMADDNDKFSGEVEIDETYYMPNRKMRTTAAKRPKKSGEMIFGLVERGGRAKAIHLDGEVTTAKVFPVIKENVAKGTVVFTDTAMTYRSLHKLYEHHQTNHGLKQYVDGNNHTQNIENLWSNMKRGVRGVYRHVDSKYLQSYVDEYAFRYSRRNDYRPMFWALMDKVTKTS